MEENIQEEVKTEKPTGRKRIIAGIFALVVIILSGFYIAHEMQFQSTDDAYVETTTVNVAPRVSGQI